MSHTSFYLNRVGGLHIVGRKRCFSIFKANCWWGFAATNWSCWCVVILHIGITTNPVQRWDC